MFGFRVQGFLGLGFRVFWVFGVQGLGFRVFVISYSQDKVQELPTLVILNPCSSFLIASDFGVGLGYRP